MSLAFYYEQEFVDVKNILEIMLSRVNPAHVSGDAYAIVRDLIDEIGVKHGLVVEIPEEHLPQLQADRSSDGGQLDYLEKMCSGNFIL